MAAPLDSASAASSLRGSASTQEGVWVSGGLEEQFHQSKIREERLEAALKDAKKRLLAQEAIGENLKEIGDWLEFVRMIDPPEDLSPEIPLPLETQGPFYTSSGSLLPTPAWVEDSLDPGWPQGHRPHLQERSPPEQRLIEEGEVLRVCWPADASIQKFGAPFTKHCWTDLVKEATKMGIHLKMRGARPVKRGRQDNSNQQSPQGLNYLSIAGPLGTTRDFYEELRTIMACKRQNWKGLRPPRKVRIHLIHQSVVRRDKKMTSAEASASLSNTSEKFEEADDDTDDGEPPREAGLQFVRLAASAAGDELAILRGEVDTEQKPDLHFPSQLWDIDEETLHSLWRLVDTAKCYLLVVCYCMVA